VPAQALVIVDCLTLWLGNQLAARATDEEVESRGLGQSPAA
jgi:adenosyl cobinamide kinase/adenosyl cobinamide phosphate guanylyltransferase